AASGGSFLEGGCSPDDNHPHRLPRGFGPGRPEASRPGSVVRQSGASLLLPQRLHLAPELLPLRPLRLGQLLQAVGPAPAGEVGVLLPVPECFLDRRSCLGRAPLGFLAPEGEVGLEPAAGLPAQAGTLLVVGLGGVSTLTGGGQGGGAGG